MTIQLIGAGFGRTGTLSIKAALEQLGFTKCYHMVELLRQPEQVSYWQAAQQGETVDWDTLFLGYQATVDYPGYRHYQKLMAHYPHAKVLLSVRDPEQWYESAASTIYRAAPGIGARLLMAAYLPFSARARNLLRVFRMGAAVWKEDFGGQFDDRAYAIERFKEHTEEVKRVVSPERLLVYEVKEGWEPLCRFLQVPVPTDKPFPRLNDRTTFQERSFRQLLRGLPKP